MTAQHERMASSILVPLLAIKANKQGVREGVCVAEKKSK